MHKGDADEVSQSVGKSVTSESVTCRAWIASHTSLSEAWFVSVWGLRNKVQHGESPEDERRIRSVTADRAIRRLYDMGRDLSHCERHPFRLSIADLLAKTLAEKELWVQLTEAFLPKAFRRQQQRDKKGQRTITEYFV